MADAECENAFLLTAIELFRGDEVGDRLEVGDLSLTRDGDVWEVSQREAFGGDELVIFQDAIRIDAFPSTRILATYLMDLDGREVECVELPDDPAEYIGRTS